MFKSWKTTLLGIAGVFGVIAKGIASGFQFGVEDITALITAIGLIFAKDHNVTGGK